jgi:hypothetical protein
MPARIAARRAGLLYSYDNRYDLDNQTSTSRWDTMGHTLQYSRARPRAHVAQVEGGEEHEAVPVPGGSDGFDLAGETLARARLRLHHDADVEPVHGFDHRPDVLG